ncbi:MAG: SDR family NAD(P)-dependent oxidoreductase [Planctomycetota bacterium]|jgi:NAD(P)-dependent dehydrogenase (short-subunit alcohol dehydrogenase family)
MAQLGKAIAIITGASAGIGLAAARRLSSLGYGLVLNARRKDRLQELAKETDAAAVVGDITDPAVRARVVEACGGRIDLLINNAGYSEPGPVEMVKEEDYRRQFDVNVFAAGAMIQAVLPTMRRRRSGRIVNISSVAGRFGYPLFGWYCASKHALEGMSDALRLEVAPWGIHVVLIEPGPVETEFFAVMHERAGPIMKDEASPYRPFFRHTSEIERDLMKRAATPDAVADVIVSACQASRPRARYAVTRMAKTTVLLSKILPRTWLDAALRRQFRVPGPGDVG